MTILSHESIGSKDISNSTSAPAMTTRTPDEYRFVVDCSQPAAKISLACLARLDRFEAPMGPTPPGHVGTQMGAETENRVEDTAHDNGSAGDNAARAGLGAQGRPTMSL